MTVMSLSPVLLLITSQHTREREQSSDPAYSRSSTYTSLDVTDIDSTALVRLHLHNMGCISSSHQKTISGPDTVRPTGEFWRQVDITNTSSRHLNLFVYFGFIISTSQSTLIYLNLTFIAHNWKDLKEQYVGFCWIYLNRWSLLQSGTSRMASPTSRTPGPGPSIGRTSRKPTAISSTSELILLERPIQSDYCFISRNLKEDIKKNPEQLMVNLILMSVQFLKSYDK